MYGKLPSEVLRLGELDYSLNIHVAAIGQDQDRRDAEKVSNG